MKSQPGPKAGEGPSDSLRSFISLLLFIHLFVLLFALSGNYFRSPLQAQVLRLLRPYSQTLNFELDYLPYQLTHATPMDVDHRIEILPDGQEESDADAWLALPDRGFRGGERYKRYQRLARLMSFLSEQDSSGAGVGMLGKSVAENFVSQREVKPKQIRCRRHLLQSPEFVTGGSAAQRDPNDASYFRVIYAANTLVSDNGQVDLVKIDSAGQVARPDSPENEGS